MCLGVPYQVSQVEGDECLVKVGSGRQRCFIGLLDNVEPGDWIVVHAGFGLEKISAEDADANRNLIGRLIEGGREGDL